MANELIQTEENSISTVNVEQALEEWNAYQTITERMLDKTDYQMIKGRQYKKKSAWRKYARAFNINTELIKEEILKNEKGRVIEATFIVRATLPTGRYADGWGNCSKFEKARANPNHDIPATAMTRATNRAIADLIGAGEVTAEEIKVTNNQEPWAKPKTTKEPTEPEVIEVEPEDIKATFETADELPLIESFVKSIIGQLKDMDRKVTKNNILKCSYEALQDGEISAKEHKEVISWCKVHCPEDIEEIVEAIA